MIDYGEWRSTNWGETITIVSTKNNVVVCRINPNANEDSGIPSEIDSANAKLIAAAPELLDVCKYSYAVLLQDPKSQFSDLVDKLKLIIEKAEV